MHTKLKQLDHLNCTEVALQVLECAASSPLPALQLKCCVHICQLVVLVEAMAPL